MERNVGKRSAATLSVVGVGQRRRASRPRTITSTSTATLPVHCKPLPTLQVQLPLRYDVIRITVVVGTGKRIWSSESGGAQRPGVEQRGRRWVHRYRGWEVVMGLQRKKKRDKDENKRNKNQNKKQAKEVKKEEKNGR